MPARTRASIAARNAAGVLPEPVGAATSACRPALIAGHASSCAAVGAAKADANHARVAGWKSSSTSLPARPSILERYSRIPPPLAARSYRMPVVAMVTGAVGQQAVPLFADILV